MTQHDYDIANAAGATVRSDINSVLEAVATNNSGATAPSVTFANMWWFDTASSLLKQRNAANTAWVTVAKKDGSGWTPYFQGSELAAMATKATVATADINDEAVTYAKMQHISAASLLLGRGAGAGAGDVQEITLGSGLSMSGTTLTSSATGVFTASYVSAELTISAAGSHSLTHGLGNLPLLVQPILVCKTAEHGYSVGDILIAPNISTEIDGETVQGGQIITITTTNINVRFGDGGGAGGKVYRVLNKTTGDGVNLTNANWRLRIRAWR